MAKHQHKIFRCMECGTVDGECACNANEKKVIWVTCTACIKKEKRK